MENYDVIISGYVSMDHIIKINSPAKIGMTSIVENKNNSKVYYGGCSINIAYSLCKLGFSALPIIRVGDDFEYLGFDKFLNQSQIPLEGLSRVRDESTSTCYLLQDNHHNHITIFYPGAMNGSYACDLDDLLFSNTKLAVMTVASLEDNQIFLNKCKKYNIPLIFGMKVDYNAFTKDFLSDALRYSKIIFTNEIERKIIEKDYGLNDITDLFYKGNAEIIITTLGENGSECCVKKSENFEKYNIGICEIKNVVDTTGSGDAYMAGFIYGYLNKYRVDECCRLGAILSSFVLQKEGCCTNIPDEKELINKFNEVKEDF